MNKTAQRVKTAQQGDVWASEHRRSKVKEVKKLLTGNRVTFVNEQQGGGYGVEMTALEYVFVGHRKLVERDGKAVL